MKACFVCPSLSPWGNTALPVSVIVAGRIIGSPVWLCHNDGLTWCLKVIQKLSIETQESSNLMKKNEPYLQYSMYKLSIVHISNEKWVYMMQHSGNPENKLSVSHDNP